MKKIFTVGRKVRVPLDERGFNSNEYSFFLTIEYNEQDLDEATIIDRGEFKALAEEIDKIQRDIIEKETGITELPMDISKNRIEIKKLMKKESSLSKLKERLAKRRGNV